MKNFISWMFRKLTPAQVSPETPVEIWILKRYASLFKCQIQKETWAESKFNDVSVEPGEYGIGNPVYIVINAINEKRITGHAIDHNEFKNLYGNVQTLNNEQAAVNRDEYCRIMQEGIDEIKQSIERIMS